MMTTAKRKTTGSKKTAADTRKRSGTFGILRKILSDFSRDFSQGTDRLADIFIDNSKKKEENKVVRLKKQTISLFKDMSANAGRNLKNISFKGVLCDTSYEVGRVSRVTKNVCVEIFHDLME